MRTLDQILIRAPVDRVFEVAADVERWPPILPHYRWVRFLERQGGTALVEMAAWRPLGPLRYPVWWVSEMTVDRAAREVRYRHVRGITRGMDVAWRLGPLAEARERRPPRLAETSEDGGTLVTVVHEWQGPRWPLVGRLAADLVIGPVFIHGIASRTLAGIKREAERA